MLKAMDPVTAAKLLNSYIKSFGNKKNLENNVAFLDLEGYLTASEVGKILNKMNTEKADKILTALEGRNIIDMDAVRAEITRVTNPPGGGHGHHSHRYGEHRHYDR
jgi:hypothetical protein